METDHLRQRLIDAGEVLAPFVDELLALAAPSVRLRPETTTRTTAAAPEGWATPSVVPGLDAGVVRVAGSFHCLVLLADGTVMAWGENAHGQVGAGLAPIAHDRCPCSAVVTWSASQLEPNTRWR